MPHAPVVLAGALGGFVAGKPLQRRAAISVTVLAACFSMLVAVMPIVPATVPIALIFVLLVAPKRPPFGRRHRVSNGREPTGQTAEARYTALRSAA